jgi:three-Cys-motif partner protein
MSKNEYDIDPDDQLPREIVGEWGQEKHQLLASYVDASRSARAKFGGTPFFVDLYCGPGRVKIRDTNIVADGGALAALRSSFNPSRGLAMPFAGAFIADKERENVDACKARMGQISIELHSTSGIAEETVAKAVQVLPRSGLHIAYLDPYGIGQLPFSIIEQLSTVPNVDLMIHFASRDLTRNLELETHSQRLEAVAPGWNVNPKLCNRRDLRKQFSDHWASLVRKCGYHLATRPYRVRNSRGAEIYLLTLASKNPLGTKIWDSLRPHPQRDLWG